MKEDISPHETTVLMSDVHDLSSVPADQIQEIDWFLSQSVSCIFFTYTTMLEHPEHNKEQLELLQDYLKSTDRKKKILTLKPLIRKKRINYPEGWEELFERWEKKEITARDFMKKCGLKRGTFYHMVADYKEQACVMKKEIRL